MDVIVVVFLEVFFSNIGPLFQMQVLQPKGILQNFGNEALYLLPQN